MTPDPSKSPQRPNLTGTAFAGLKLGEYLGAGRRCNVYAAGDGDQVLKVYHPKAADKHWRRYGIPLARYEFERNRAFLAAPGLAAHVARPMAYHAAGATQLFLQSRVRGESLTAFGYAPLQSAARRVLTEIASIVGSAHRAGLYDLDLRPENIIVTRQADGGLRPVLFDFNKTPYHVHPPNPMFGMLVACGFIAPEARDLRCLRRLQRAYLPVSHWWYLFWSMPFPLLTAELEVFHLLSVP